MVNWLYSQQITGKFVYPQLWESSKILIQINCPITPVWRKAGYLKIEALIEGEYFTVDYKPIEFGNSLIDISVPIYRLSFEPVSQLTTLYPNTTISIYQLSQAEVKNTTVGINFSVQPRSTGAIVDELKTTGLTVSQEVMAANVDRAEGGTIYNRTNKAMYVRWGTTAATSADLAVTAGSNIDVPDSYTGAAQAICASGATGNILTQTVSYI
jgi:hypothetical protein